MAMVELHGRAEAVFVAGMLLLLASFIWRLAHTTAQTQWGIDYAAVVCAILAVTSGAKNNELYNRRSSLVVRSLLAVMGTMWGFGLLRTNPLYVLTPVDAALLYFSFEEILAAKKSKSAP